MPIPSLLALGAVHQHLVRAGPACRPASIVESGEAREIHHVAALIGYGAAAVNPYLLLDSLADLHGRAELPPTCPPTRRAGGCSAPIARASRR